MRTRFICPFCRRTVLEIDTIDTPHAVIERVVREHLVERHPIRWRLSRRFRQAMRKSREVEAFVEALRGV